MIRRRNKKNRIKFRKYKLTVGTKRSILTNNFELVKLRISPSTFYQQKAQPNSILSAIVSKTIDFNKMGQNFPSILEQNHRYLVLCTWRSFRMTDLWCSQISIYFKRKVVGLSHILKDQKL